MIPTNSDGLVPPAGSGSQLFHIIVDDADRTFTIDGPGGPNGMRLHYEMLRVSRAQKKRYRDFDLYCASHKAALATMHGYFPRYKFMGTWAAST
jgi:hypothetical protein